MNTFSTHKNSRRAKSNLIIALLLFPILSMAQVDSTWFNLVKKAEDHQFKKNFDSALQLNLKAIEIGESKRYHANALFSILLNNTGYCYEKKILPQQAHVYYARALSNARTYNHQSEKISAFVYLNELHNQVVKKNWPFTYHPPTVTIEADVYYSIEQVKVIDDSVQITILGGRLDGITDLSLAGSIYTRRSTNTDTFTRQGGLFFGMAYIRKTTDNRTILTTLKTNDNVPIVGDLVKINSVIPIGWNSFAYKSSLVNNVAWSDNYRQKIYDRRFLYYFLDSTTTTDIGEVLKNNVQEVLELIVDDTAKGKKYQAADEGLFTGYNLYNALNVSSDFHYSFFQNYALNNAESYRGNDYKFSEVYATWVMYKAPMLANDIKKFLLTRGKYVQQFCRYFKAEIEKEKLDNKWFDEGLQLVYQDNIKEARAIAKLLYDYGSANQSSSVKGWACYLETISLHKLGNTAKLDSFLNVAEQYFINDKNNEGLLWVKNGRQTLFTKPRVSFTVQSGHLMSFKIAMSPNSRYFATGSDDHTIKIWDVYNAKEVKTIYGHSAEVNDITYSPGGRYLASCSDDSTIKIWNSFNYGLMQTIKMKKVDSKIVFSPDTKKLVSVGGDSSIRVWDVFTGKLLHSFDAHKGKLSDITFHPLEQNRLVSAGRDSMIYFWDLDSMKTNGYIKARGKVVRSRFSNNGKFMYQTFTDSSMTVWKTDPYKPYFTRKLQAGEVSSSIYLSNPYFSPDNKYILYANNLQKQVIEDIETLYYRSYSLPARELLQEQYLNNDGSFLIQKMGRGLMVLTDFSNYSFQTGYNYLNSTEIKQYQNPPVALKFSKTDSSLYILGLELAKLNLYNGTTEKVTNAMQPYFNEALVFDNEHITTYLSSDKDSVKVVDYVAKKTLASFPSLNGEKIRTYLFDRAEAVCYIASESGTLQRWDVKNERQLYAVNLATTTDSIIKRIFYDTIYNRLFLLIGDSAVFVVDASNGKQLQKIDLQQADYVTFSPRKVYISNDKKVAVHDLKSLALLKNLQLNDAGEYTTMAYSPVYNRMVIASADAKVFVLDANTDEVLYTKKDNTFQVADIKFNPQNNLLAISSFNNLINLYDFTTGKLLLNINTPLGNDFVLSDSVGHYMASKKALQGIVFNYNNNAYNFEQFDLQYNRPDIILQKTKRADSSLVQSYYLAYKKRLKKAGISENDNMVNFNLPIIRMPDLSMIRPVTSASEYTISVDCYDPAYKLQSIHVLVNNTPVYGAKGFDLSPLDTFQVTKKLSIPLSVGNNSIKIYCVNEKGVASLKESFDVISKYQPKTKAATYFIGIAVADYKDSTMNLTYSAKDVRDLAASFKEIYQDVIIDTLINNKATKENIAALRKKLNETTVNDKIIMAVTGHGLLSDSLDFYYATYDVDFKDPVKRGLKYEALENLLNDIPARQKLLLIDACHSGALDKETMLNENITSTVGITDSVKAVGNRSNIRIKPAKVNLNNTFDLMQNLFADLSNSNGTVVISAAGGLEYAFESPEWNNGVFTYCVRKGLTEADRDGGNFDFNVSVQELQQYVSRKVSELTRGRQKPTSRRENLDYNWNIK